RAGRRRGRGRPPPLSAGSIAETKTPGPPVPGFFLDDGLCHWTRAPGPGMISGIERPFNPLILRSFFITLAAIAADQVPPGASAPVRQVPRRTGVFPFVAPLAKSDSIA